jgi:copper(I)-binding protein
VGALIGAVALTGCGAGQVAQTSEQVAAVAGANATVGPIGIRNARIEYDTAAHGAAIWPAGSSAPLEMNIVNTGPQPDTLVSATSPVASNVEVSGTTTVPGGMTLVVEGTSSQSATPSAATTTPGATVTAAPTTSAAPTTTAAPSSTGAQAEPDFVVRGTAHVVLTGLRQDLQVGPTYPVTLTFQRAGSVQVDVPVASPDAPRTETTH